MFHLINGLARQSASEPLADLHPDFLEGVIFVAPAKPRKIEQYSGFFDFL